MNFLLEVELDHWKPTGKVPVALLSLLPEDCAALGYPLVLELSYFSSSVASDCSVA